MTTIEVRRASRDVDQLGSIVAALCVFVFGSISTPFLPLVVGALTDHLGFAPRQVGLIASADMFGMFLSAVCALYWIRRVNWRMMALGLAIVLMAAHIVSASLHAFVPLVFARLLAGFCGGSMMALGATALTDAKTPERNVALMTGAHMGVAAVGLFILPGIIAKFGVAGAYLPLAAGAVVAAIMSILMPSSGHWPKIVSEPVSVGAVLPQSMRLQTIALTFFATLPAFFFHLAYTASWSYMERIGLRVGLTPENVGHVLSVSFAAGILGSAAAWLVADRFGRLIPCAVTMVLQLIALGTLLFYHQGAGAFVAALMVYSFLTVFPIPYQMSLAIKVDKTGRATVLYLLMLKAGIAIGPFFASNFVSANDFSGPIIIAAIFFSLSFFTLWGATAADRALERKSS